MSGSLSRGGGENVPGIPGACATHNFPYLSRGPCVYPVNVSKAVYGTDKNKIFYEYTISDSTTKVNLKFMPKLRSGYFEVFPILPQMVRNYNNCIWVRFHIISKKWNIIPMTSLVSIDTYVAYSFGSYCIKLWHTLLTLNTMYVTSLYKHEWIVIYIKRHLRCLLYQWYDMIWYDMIWYIIFRTSVT